MTMAPRKPRCIVIAGPNGAGKTTFARAFLLKDAGITHFVNFPIYRALADSWTLYDNSSTAPILSEDSR